MIQTSTRPLSLPVGSFSLGSVAFWVTVLFVSLFGFRSTSLAQFEYDWPDHSALAEGQWYRIATTRSGFHKIDVALLDGLGIDAASVDPAKVNLYGHGGDALPIDPARSSKQRDEQSACGSPVHDRYAAASESHSPS